MKNITVIIFEWKSSDSKHPVGLRLTMSDPVINESTAVDQVVKPAPKGLEGGVSRIGPQAEDLPVQEGFVDQH